ncbi:MAG: HTH-type transcriptional repressor RspR [Firmicutes bacterium]|nr:HTH-type transcriptional repressor RspR [Bacillota bacterium]MBT9157684.1 HTH-type transcriptional repressor RspR [Bacillota bacterium]
MIERMVPIKLDNYKPLRDIVFEHLREAIVAGRLRPGERLMEVQLAEEMGVSRTPVREAIRKLELEGLVVMITRRGAYVSDLSVKDIAETFEIRAALESLAAGLAAERITPEGLEQLERTLVQIGECMDDSSVDRLVELDEKFHSILFAASRNQRLSQIVSNLREQINRFRQTSLATPGRFRAVFQEHKRIAEAISEGNSSLAQALAKEHMENAELSIMEWVKDHKV